MSDSLKEMSEDLGEIGNVVALRIAAFEKKFGQTITNIEFVHKTADFGNGEVKTLSIKPIFTITSK